MVNVDFILPPPEVIFAATPMVIVTQIDGIGNLSNTSFRFPTKVLMHYPSSQICQI